MLNPSISMPNSPLRCLRGGILASLLAYTCLAGGVSVAEEVQAPTPERQAELANFVRQDCGSCHGLLMEGGLGVPLTPTALEGKPVEALRDTILYGRNGTTMPPWSPFLTEAEAEWIVRMLLKGSF